MPGLKKTALLLAAIVVTSFSHPASAYTLDVRQYYEQHLLDGRRVINVVDDFLAFWEQARGKTLRRQRRLWRRMVESKHRNYFERAVYRGAAPEERLDMLNHFLIRVPWHVEEIERFNKNARAAVLEGLANFKLRFREYEQKTDIYIGLSLFMFDGSVRPINNEGGTPDTLCLGAEALASYSPEELRIVIAHELFHLYHFGFLFRNPSASELRAAHIPLMVEGLAVAGTEAVYPYRPATLYLHFSEEELAFQEEDLIFNCQRFLRMIEGGASAEQYEQWFTMGADEDLPPRGGYLLGYEVARRMLETFSLEHIARMAPAELRQHAEEQLTAIINERVLLIAPVE